MKYLFIITGVAYGHLTRQEAILNKLKKIDKKAEIVIAGYNTSKKHFNKDYKIVDLKPLYFNDESPRVKTFKVMFNNYKIPLTMKENCNIVNNFTKEFQPDIVVSDWEPFSLFLKDCYLVWNYKPYPVKTPSFLFQKFLLNILFLVIRLTNKKILIPSLDKKESTKNIIYFPLIIRKYSNEVKASKYKDAILVMIGGSEFGISLARKIKNISKYFNENFIFFGLKCKSKNCIGFPDFREDYLSFLKSSKAVISLAGYSGLSEAIVYKKPNLVFPLKNWIEQDSSSREFEQYTQIGDIESSEDELKNVLKNFLLNLNNYKKRLSKLNVKDGASEIAEFLYKKAKS
jgi:uncharacterized protein (TIGR00661 family)